MSNSNLILVHGWATDSNLWSGVISGLPSDINALSLDLPGHGESKEEWLGSTLSCAVDVIRKAAKDKGPAIGLGWSLGGQTLLQTSALVPELFKALVIVDSTPAFIATEDFPYGQPRAQVRRMVMDMAASPEKTLKRFLGLNFTEDELNKESAKEFIATYEALINDKRDYLSLSMALAAHSSVDIRALLKDIKIPVLIIHGALDSVVPIEAARYLNENLPNATLHTFAHAGHAPFITETGRFMELLLDFLNSYK